MKRAFSILEIIITIGILAIIVLVLGEIIVKQSELYNTESVSLDVLRTHNQAIEMMQNDIRSARKIAAGTGAYISATSTIALDLAAMAADGTPLVGVDYVVYSYDSQAALTRIVIPDASSIRKADTRILDPYVQSLLFTYSSEPFTNSDAVTIALVSSKVTRGKTKSASDTVQVKLRNK